MEKYQEKMLPFAKTASEILRLYNSFYGLKYGEIIHHSITVGCSLHDQEYSSFFVDGAPWSPPTHEPLKNCDVDVFVFKILESQLRNLEKLAEALNLDLIDTLDWCIRCWEHVYALKSEQRTFVCIMPGGRHIPANFGILDS